MNTICTIDALYNRKSKQNISNIPKRNRSRILYRKGWEPDMRDRSSWIKILNKGIVTLALNCFSVFILRHKDFNLSFNRIGDAMASVSVVDREFEPQAGQIKNYKICIYCLCTKHAALRSKSTDCLALNQDNVFYHAYI